MSYTPSVPFALRLAALAAALVAAVAPLAFEGSRPRLVNVLDVSASASTRSSAAGDAAASSTVVFADGAVRLAPARSVAHPPVHASDLAAGLRLAAATTGPFRVHVVTDGRVTSSRADLAAAARALRSAGCVGVDFAQTPTRPLPPHVATLRGPGRVRSGASVALVAAGDAGTRGGRLVLRSDGIEIDARDIPPGPFHTSFVVAGAGASTSADAAGRVLRTFAIDFAAAERSPSAPPAAVARVVVGGEGRVLVIRGTPSARLPAELPPALAADAAFVAPDDPGLAASAAMADLVVLHGVRPADLGAREERALRDAVSRGCGMLILGADGAYAGGAGAGRPLDEISPLGARAPDDPGVLLYVALDGSGSMAEPWPGSGRTRDAVVRASAGALADGLADDVTISLRRFADALVPGAGDPWRGSPSAVRAAIEALPAPRGGTALIPPLTEAAAEARRFPGGARHAVLFTDGRTAEAGVELSAAARDVVAAGCGLTIVVDQAQTRVRLATVLAESGALVVAATSAADLTRELRLAAERARPGREPLRDVAIRTAAAAELLATSARPAGAEWVGRTWPAADAAILAWAGDAPVAGLRRHGAGRVAAVSATGLRFVRPDGAATFFGALAGWAARPVAADVVVRREDDRLVVRDVSDRTRALSVRIDGVERVLPLVRAASGAALREVLLPTRRDVGPLARLLDASGGEIAACGLDAPAAAEYSGVEPVDLAWLPAAASTPSVRRPLRPWCSALAVVLLVVAHLLAAHEASRTHGRSSPPGGLPM